MGYIEREWSGSNGIKIILAEDICGFSYPFKAKAGIIS
jgi:hypothetical protein